MESVIKRLKESSASSRQQAATLYQEIAGERKHLRLSTHPGSDGPDKAIFGAELDQCRVWREIIER